MSPIGFLSNDQTFLATATGFQIQLLMAIRSALSNGTIDRVERFDKSYADIDQARLGNIQFMGNKLINIKTEAKTVGP